jgi:hypothetical protein
LVHEIHICLTFLGPKIMGWRFSAGIMMREGSREERFIEWVEAQ